MKILGIDWGEKRIGLAFSGGTLAAPYGIVGSFDEVVDVTKREHIEKIVLGLPEGKHAAKVKEWGRKLEEVLGIPVILRSEILTTRQALEKALEAGKPRKSRRNLDAFSASLILQEYLDQAS